MPRSTATLTLGVGQGSMIQALILSPGAVDRSIRYGGLAMLAGFTLIGICAAGAPSGAFCGMMSMMYGVTCGFCRGWNRERGVWMISAAFLILLVPIYLVLAWFIRFGAGTATWGVIDMFLGTAMLGVTCRLLLSVLVYNRRVSKLLKNGRIEDGRPTSGSVLP